MATPEDNFNSVPISEKSQKTAPSVKQSESPVKGPQKQDNMKLNSKEANKPKKSGCC